LECGDSSPLSFYFPTLAKESGVETPHSKKPTILRLSLKKRRRLILGTPAA
jgi:hypothetical protein